MSPELLITTLLTPVLGAVATLFWLLNKEKEKRIEDRDQAIERLNTRLEERDRAVDEYRDRIIPTLDIGNKAIASMVDLLERQEGRS